MFKFPQLSYRFLIVGLFESKFKQDPYLVSGGGVVTAIYLLKKLSHLSYHFPLSRFFCLHLNGAI